MGAVLVDPILITAPNLLDLSDWGAAFVKIFLGHYQSLISIVSRLLGASMSYPVLRGCLFSGASLARWFYFRSSDQMRRLDVLLNSHLIIFNSQL